ncbi:MAG TPA: PrsW family glutamic-type intramembrane protease, partial [Micromonosporaceae bacterium]
MTEPSAAGGTGRANGGPPAGRARGSPRASQSSARAPAGPHGGATRVSQARAPTLAPPDPAATPTGRAHVATPTDRAPVGLVGKATTVPLSDPTGTVVPTPFGTSRRRSLELPAFWVLVALLAIGVWRFLALVLPAFVRFPIAMAVAAALFVLYAIPFVIVAHSVDFFEPEPKLLLGAAVGWGALVATTTAVTGNAAARSIVAKLTTPAFAVAWGPAIIGPTLEEVLKTLGVVIVVLVARRQVNSVADGAVYGAFVGLGFQIVEDFVDAGNAVVLAGRGDNVEPVFLTFLVRGFLGGLWSHTLFSALAGAGVAYFVVHRGNRSFRRRLAVGLGAVAGAWLFHFVWNSPWFENGFGFGGFGILAGLIVKGAPALVLVA